MSSQLKVNCKVLRALAEFTCTGKGAIEANQYTTGILIKVSENEVRFAASNGAMLAVCNLQVDGGNQDDVLLREASLFGVSEHGEQDEFILPVQKVIKALKAYPNDDLYITYQQYSGTDINDKRGKVTIEREGGFSLKCDPILTLFSHMDTLTKVEFAQLQTLSQVAIAPTLLVKFVKAAKLLGIQHPDRIVLAFTGSSTTIGIQAGLADWFYGTMLPMTAPTRYEGTTPAWAYPEDDEIAHETAMAPEVVQQLTWDYDEAHMPVTVSPEEIDAAVNEDDDAKEETATDTMAATWTPDPTGIDDNEAFVATGPEMIATSTDEEPKDWLGQQRGTPLYTAADADGQAQ